MTELEEARLKLKDDDFLITQLNYQYLIGLEKNDIELMALCEELKSRVYKSQEMYETLELANDLLTKLHMLHPELKLDNCNIELNKLLAKVRD